MAIILDLKIPDCVQTDIRLAGRDAYRFEGEHDVMFNDHFYDAAESGACWLEEKFGKDTVGMQFHYSLMNPDGNILSINPGNTVHVDAGKKLTFAVRARGMFRSGTNVFPKIPHNLVDTRVHPDSILKNWPEETTFRPEYLELARKGGITALRPLEGQGIQFELDPHAAPRVPLWGVRLAYYVST